MTSSGSDILQQLDSLLGQRNQAWLLGAGVSVESNIPLMNALTKRVFSRAESENPLDHEVLKYIMSQLADDAHIEHVLSQIADHRAIAERSKTKEVIFDATKFTLDDLDKFHQRLLTWLAETDLCTEVIHIHPIPSSSTFAFSKEMMQSFWLPFHEPRNKKD